MIIINWLACCLSMVGHCLLVSAVDILLVAWHIRLHIDRQMALTIRCHLNIIADFRFRFWFHSERRLQLLDSINVSATMTYSHLIWFGSPDFVAVDSVVIQSGPKPLCISKWPKWAHVVVEAIFIGAFWSLHISLRQSIWRSTFVHCSTHSTQRTICHRRILPLLMSTQSLWRN